MSRTIHHPEEIVPVLSFTAAAVALVNALEAERHRVSPHVREKLDAAQAAAESL
jgi:hypothetical protein